LKKFFKAILEGEEEKEMCGFIVKKYFKEYDTSKSGNMSKEDFIHFCTSEQYFDDM
jgi:hypothetical protein